MPGRLIDLGQPGVRLPASIIVDTNLVVAGLDVATPLAVIPSTPRAKQFLELLRNQPALGFLTPMIVQELFHVALRELLRAEVVEQNQALAMAFPTRRRFDWIDLYKTMPHLLDAFAPDLQRLRRLLRLNNLHVLQPDEFASLPNGSLWEDELLRLIGRYYLDTSDAAILLDAQRAGITSIATLDADLRRAELDFDVYTWP